MSNPVPPPENDAFVIYADADADWCVRELITPLSEAQLRVIHKRIFPPGLPELLAEDRAIRSSLCTIAFLTPEWVRSKQATFLADRAWAMERLVPVLAWECEPDPRVRDLTRIDLTDPTRWKDEFGRLLEHLGRTAQEAQAAAARTVVRGLQALSRLMTHPPVQQAVTGYEVSFQRAADEIESIGHLKALHDDFQTAEGSFRLVRRASSLAVAGPVADAPVEDELGEAADDLLADLRQLRQTAAQTGLPEHELPWLGQLGSIIDGLEAAMDGEASSLLGRPLERLQRMLGLVPPRINSRIVEGVARLSLVQVADSLQEVRTTFSQYQFDELAHARFDAFAKSVASLRTLARNLEALHANHNWLQAIDGSLLPLDRNRRPGRAEVADLWQDVVGPVSQLDAAAGPTWVGEFRARARDVDQALAQAGTPAGLRALQRAFNTFRTELDQAFNRADRDLLTLCEQLRTVGQALRQTIERMQNA